jgi:hypothetical protein
LWFVVCGLWFVVCGLWRKRNFYHETFLGILGTLGTNRNVGTHDRASLQVWQFH